MADLTPISNQLNVNLAILLDDPVSGADNGIKAVADGVRFTSAARNFYLNESYREIVNKLVRLVGIVDSMNYLSGVIKTQNIAFNSSGVAINGNYLYDLGLYDTGKPFTKGNKLSYDNDTDPLIDKGYAIEGGRIYAYKRVNNVLSILNSGSGILLYLSSDRKTSAGVNIAPNVAPDLTLDARWHGWCVYYAAMRACYDVGSEEWIIKGKQYEEAQKSILGA